MQIVRIVCLIDHFSEEQIDKLVEGILFRTDIVSPQYCL